MASGPADAQRTPANLVVIGEFEALLSAFAARWDETEAIKPGRCACCVRP
jgi:hypothetical protein